MPTITVRARVSADLALAAIAAAAEVEGFTIEDQSAASLVARRGAVLSGVVFGAVAPYLRFDAHVTPEPDGAVTLSVRWHRPWWQGILGLIRSRRTMRRVMGWVVQGLREGGTG